LADAGIRFEVKQHHEVLPSIELKTSDGAEYRATSGHRIIWTVRELDHMVDGQFDSPNGDMANDDGGRGGGGGGDATDEDAPARSAAPRRPTKEQRREAILEGIRNIARAAPLSYGLSRSFEEAQKITNRVETMRADFIKQRKGALNRDAASYAATMILTPSEVPSLKFGCFRNAMEFLTKGVQPFFSLGGTPGAQHPGWPLDDPFQQFLHVKEGSTDMARFQEKITSIVTGGRLPLKVEDYYAHPLSWMHFDKIFSFERSLYYNSHLAHFHIEPEVLKIKAYNPSARSKQPNYDLPRRWHLAQQAAAAAEAARQQTMEDVVMEEEEVVPGAEELFDEMFDTEDMPAAMSLPRPRDPTVEAVNADLISNYVDKLGNAWSRMPYRPTFPFRGLISEVNALVTSSEMLFTTCIFPFAMGTKLPPDDQLRTGTSPLVSKPERRWLSQCINACIRMREAEVSHRAIRVDPAFDLNPSARGRSHASSIVTIGLERNERVGLNTIMDESALNPENSNPGEMDDIPLTLEQCDEALRQAQAVRMALSSANQRFRSLLYTDLDFRKQSRPSDSKADLMPEAEFSRRSVLDDTPNISAIEQATAVFAEFCKNKKFDFTPENKTEILSSADVLPKWMTERNACLSLRMPNQLRIASMRVRQRNALARLENNFQGEESPDNPEYVAFMMALATLRREHTAEVNTFLIHEWKNFHDRFMVTSDGSPATLAIRDAIKEFAKPQTAETSRLLPSNLDQRPFVQFRIAMCNDVYKAERTLKQNMVYLERGETCAFGAFQWSADRSEPALNYTSTGAPGIGKSHLLKLIKRFMPSGVCHLVSHETQNVHNIDMDIDNMVVMYEELPAALVTPNTKLDATQQEIINRTKARFTAFQTQSRVYEFDEETGQRRFRDCFSSQHIVTISCTNQSITHVEGGMGRRFMFDILPTRVTEADGDKAYQQNANPRNALEIANLNRLRTAKQELCAMYAYLRMASRAGIRKDEGTVSRHGVAFCNAILDRAHLNGIPVNNGTHRAWILEIAQSLQDQYACYMGLFSNIAEAVYSDPATGLTRWTPESVLKMVLPFSMLTKDAVIHALSLFDFLFCSREENQLLMTIAETLCHFSTPSQWKFKPKLGATSADEVEHEYLVFKGRTLADLYFQIKTAHKDHGDYRREEIEAFLKKYMSTTINSYGIEPITDAQGRVTGAKRRAPSDDVYPMDRKHLMIEEHTNAPPKERYCMAISIEFLCNRFKIDFPTKPKKIKKSMRAPEFKLDTSFLDQPECIDTIREWTECLDSRAPIVKSIREVLNGKTLEVSDYEHPDLFPPPKWDSPILQYNTGYLPDDVILTSSRLDSATGESEISVKRIPVDGCNLLIRGERGTKSTIIVDNYSRLTPTATRTMYQDNAEQLAIERDKSLAYGVQYDRNDPDYIAAVEQMQALGNPGIDALHWYLVFDIISTRNMEQFPDEAVFTQELFAAIPELDINSNTPLPYGFPPFTYRIQRQIDRINKLQRNNDFATKNMLDRIKSTDVRREARDTDNANGAFAKMSDIEQSRRCRDMALFQRQAALRAAKPTEATATKKNKANPKKRAREEQEQSNGGSGDDLDALGLGDGPTKKKARVDGSRSNQPTLGMFMSDEDEDEEEREDDGSAMDIDRV
jgi:hypothetical protein